MKKRLLSKSQISIFRQCPYKWHLIYKQNKKSTPSPEMNRGKEIHKEIENFYKNIDLVKVNDKRTPVILPKKNMNLIKNFLDFEKKRIIKCVDKWGEFDEKYFKPVFQELKVEDEKLALRGIIDAVYINPKDNGVIVIDWKSGKFNKSNLNSYRFELAIYKELLERSGKVEGEVKYWGIYFIDQNRLFFEKVERKHIDRVFRIINNVREKMESGKYPRKPSFYCRWCDFAEECSPWRLK